MITGLVRRAKGNAGVARGPHELNRDHVASLQGHHYAGVATGQRAHGARAKVRRQHAVKRVRTSTTLKMTQDHAARLPSRTFFEIALQVLADAAEPGCTRTITLVLINQLVPDFDGPFRDDDNTKV